MKHYRVSSRGDLVFEFFEIDLAEALTGKFQKSLKLPDGEMIQIQVSESTNTKFHLSRVVYDFWDECRKSRDLIF